MSKARERWGCEHSVKVPEATALFFAIYLRMLNYIACSCQKAVSTTSTYSSRSHNVFAKA